MLERAFNGGGYELCDVLISSSGATSRSKCVIDKGKLEVFMQAASMGCEMT